MKISKKEIRDFIAFSVLILLSTLFKHLLTNANKDPNFEVYVFIDRVNVLHTSSDCKGIKPPKKAKMINIQDLQTEHLNKICSRCVSEQQFAELSKRVKGE